MVLLYEKTKTLLFADALTTKKHAHVYQSCVRVLEKLNINIALTWELIETYGVYSIGILMNCFQSLDFNGSYLILILCGSLIKCCRFDIYFLGFNHNVSKSHDFWWYFKKFKYTKQSHKIDHFMKSKKFHQHLNTIRF